MQETDSRAAGDRCRAHAPLTRERRNVLAVSVRRGALERRARERLGVQLHGPAAAATPDDGWLENLDADLERALPELGESERGAVELRALGELAYEDVGRKPASRRARHASASRAGWPACAA